MRASNTAKTRKFNWDALITSLAELLVGILLLINPDDFTIGIIIAVGVTLCLIGIKSAIAYFRSDALSAAASQSLSKGLIFLFIGCFCTFNSNWFIDTFPVLAILYGAVMLLAGLSKVSLWSIRYG